jgi:ribonuclease BN (tRNA processing enzyme)
MSFQVRVLGCGEAFDGSGLGNTSFLLESKRHPSLLVDCGYQVPERLWRNNRHQKLDAVCFTHLHGDHALGIVPLLTRFWEEKRTRSLDMIGPRGTEKWISSALQLGYPGMLKKLPFDLHFRVLEANRPLELQLGTSEIRLQGARTTHSVLNHAIRFELPQGRSFSVSGDGQITPEVCRLVSGVDLHFQECFWRKPRAPSHADLVTLRAAWQGKLGAAAPRSIVLTHVSRYERAGLTRDWAKLAKVDPRWKLAEPEQVYRLGVVSRKNLSNR